MIPLTPQLFPLSSCSSISSGLEAGRQCFGVSWPWLFLYAEPGFLSAFRVLSLQHAGIHALVLQRKRRVEAPAAAPCLGPWAAILPFFPARGESTSAPVTALSRQKQVSASPGLRHHPCGKVVAGCGTHWVAEALPADGACCPWNSERGTEANWLLAPCEYHCVSAFLLLAPEQHQAGSVYRLQLFAPHSLPGGSGCRKESLWVLLAMLGLLPVAAEAAPSVPVPWPGRGTGREEPPCPGSRSHRLWSCLSQGIVAGGCGCRAAEDILSASPGSPPATLQCRAVGARGPIPEDAELRVFSRLGFSRLFWEAGTAPRGCILAGLSRTGRQSSSHGKLPGEARCWAPTGPLLGLRGVPALPEGLVCVAGGAQPPLRACRAEREPAARLNPAEMLEIVSGRSLAAVSKPFQMAPGSWHQLCYSIRGKAGGGK